MEPACFAGGCWRNDQVSVWAGGLAWMRVSHAQCVRLGSTAPIELRVGESMQAGGPLQVSL